MHAVTISTLCRLISNAFLACDKFDIFNVFVDAFLYWFIAFIVKIVFGRDIYFLFSFSEWVNNNVTNDLLLDRFFMEASQGHLWSYWTLFDWRLRFGGWLFDIFSCIPFRSTGYLLFDLFTLFRVFMRPFRSN